MIVRSGRQEAPRQEVKPAARPWRALPPPVHAPIVSVGARRALRVKSVVAWWNDGEGADRGGTRRPCRPDRAAAGGASRSRRRDRGAQRSRPGRPAAVAAAEEAEADAAR